MKRLYGLYLALAVPLLISSGHIQADNASCCKDNPCNDYYSCSDDNRFFIKADVLYWRAAQEGLDSFISGSVSENTSTSAEPTENNSVYDNTSFSKGKRHRFNFDWKGGYRIGFGVNFCDGWVAAADWTHYQGHAKGHQSAPKVKKFVVPDDPQFISASIGESKAKSFGHWNLDYDVLDITAITPTYCAASCLSWNIFGGLKAAWIDQKINLNSKSYSTSTSIYTSATNTGEGHNSYKYKYRTDYYAVGPQLGGNLKWNLGCGFSIYGNAAGALVYANFNNKYRTKSHSSSQSTSFYPSQPSNTSTSTSDSSSLNKNGDYLCRPVMDLGLGVSWLKKLCYCGRESTLMLRLGWEHHQWFDQDQLGSGGDLYLDGVTLSASLFF